jgi:hypothetical protein
LLNRALKSAVLAPTFPELQVAVSVDPAGVERLLLSLAQGTAPAGTYRVLAYHPAREWLSGTALRGLLREIAALPAGWDTAVEILQMRLFADASSKREHDPALLEAGRELLMLVSFGTRHTLGNYRLGEITKVCLVGATGETVAREISRRLKAAVTAHETHVFYQDDLLCGLLRTQPLATMDGLCAGDAADLTSGIRILQGAREFRQDPIALVAEEDIVFWCDKEPVGRYPAIATIVPVSMPSDGAGLTWTAIARRLLARAPDPVAVLRGYVRQFGPIWHGAELASVETHVKLLDEFATHEDPRLASFAMNERARLQAAIENARRANSAADRESDQRFE